MDSERISREIENKRERGIRNEISQPVTRLIGVSANEPSASESVRAVSLRGNQSGFPDPLYETKVPRALSVLGTDNDPLLTFRSILDPSRYSDPSAKGSLRSTRYYYYHLRRTSFAKNKLVPGLLRVAGKDERTEERGSFVFKR